MGGRKIAHFLAVAYTLIDNWQPPLYLGSATVPSQCKEVHPCKSEFSGCCPIKPG
jgi:hypothetical protein